VTPDAPTANGAVEPEATPKPRRRTAPKVEVSSPELELVSDREPPAAAKDGPPLDLPQAGA
jgi:hypothetical protein